MPFYKQNNVELWYELRGTSGSVVTLINGHTRTTADYDDLSAGLVQAGYRVLVFDNRGSGKTRSDLEFGCQDLIADVVGLWSLLGISKSHLLGFSMGGYLAQAVAITHPEYIDRLILLSTSPGDHHVNHETDSWITETASDLDTKLQSFFSPTFVRNNQTYMQRMIELTRKAVQDGRFGARAEAQKKALFQFPVSDHVQEITAPTLIMHGRIDHSVFPAAALELKSKIRNSQLVWLDDTAHFSLIEQPGKVCTAVLGFLQAGENSAKHPQ